jgi:hypothetical protein
MEDTSMTSENVTDPKFVESAEMVSAKAVDDHLIDELVHRAQAAEGLQLTGEGGLPAAAHAAAGAALEGEITDRLGYDKHDAAGKNRGNSCNGKRSKTVLTDVGPVEITVRRDRDGSFEPKIVKKRQKRLPRVDEMVISACSPWVPPSRSPTCPRPAPNSPPCPLPTGEGAVDEAFGRFRSEDLHQGLGSESGGRCTSACYRQLVKPGGSRG